MLKIQRPDALSRSDGYSVQQRSFFLATRVFEITRSLVFSSRTFLSRPEWSASLAMFWQNEGVALWHPKEALFDLMPLISELSIRTSEFCEEAPQLPAEIRHALAVSLGKEGLILQVALQHWWSTAAAWEQRPADWSKTCSKQSKPDIELLIGRNYFHAISIYLSGTYDVSVIGTQSSLDT